MNFGQAITTVFKKYAEFSGRASRSEYWWWVLFVALVSIPFNIINQVTTSVGTTEVAGLALGAGLVYILWSLAIFLPSLAVLVRRLRDAGYAWGWVFIALVPFAGPIVLLVFVLMPSKD
ncbi:TPA: DUF805 domain-containing protein [Candidatus Saccharibacteria bacterium]|nr:DUF805 domain-containing protein [Candidatus Saccharibacteria bacterium]|tara:strand:- start:338 stop:694 length:357 start_codon:yes stop_codon:yes gene_type:complete